MKLVKVSPESGNQLFINPEYVSAVIEHEGRAHIYIEGDVQPFSVQGGITTEEIVKLLTE